MNKLHKQITSVSAAMIFIAAVFTANQTFAANTTLNGVEISSSGSRGYDIVLNTDTATNVKKKTVGNDKLVLDLKNTTVSKDAGTVYKNADGIENVILKPKANDLQIEINGKAAGNSTISLNNELPATPKNYDNTVFINKPLDSYAPIHEEELEETAGAGFIGLMRQIVTSQSLKNLLGSSNLGWIICVMLMVGFYLVTNKNGRKQQKVSVKIASTPEDKENKLLKAALERKEGLIAEGLGQRRTQLQPRKPQSQPQVSAQKTNYGLKAYGNQPAGASTSSFRVQNIPTRENLANLQPTVANRPLRASVSTATRQELQESTKKNEVHIDNVKFLESMAKIYERSGRVDLATGLANNIKKAKTIR